MFYAMLFFVRNEQSLMQNKHKRLLRKIIDHVYFFIKFFYSKKKRNKKIKITFRSF